jgi:hypothetical protein
MTDPNDPTQVYRPITPAGPPTQAIAPVGEGPVPPGGEGPPIGGGPTGGGPGGGTNPFVIALLALIVVLALAIVVLLIVNRKSSSSTAASTTAPGATTTAASTTAPPTTLAATLPPLPSTAPTTTSTPSTTTAPSTTALNGSNRPPTPAEEQAIQADNNLGPNAVVDQIWIAGSDDSWALEHVRPAAGHQNDFQAAYRILHNGGDTWALVSSGTAEVQCGTGVPTNVAADFADILGTCPPGG